MSEEPPKPLALQGTRKYEFIIHKLPRPNANEVLYVHSLSIETLKQFVLQTRRYSTDDTPDEALAVYEAIGSPQLSERKFACLTAYIAETFHGRVTQGSYSEGSNLGLILYREKIANRVLVFNGDVATLGRGLLDGKIAPSEVKSMWGTESVLVAHLRNLSKNNRFPQTEPRLRGGAFEARLFEGIAPTEVSHVYVANRLDEDAMAAAAALETLRDKLGEIGQT